MLGPDGAGKTTAVRILATLSDPDAGHARIAGHDVARDAEQARAGIGLAGQHAAVDEKLTGRGNLRLFGRAPSDLRPPCPCALPRARDAESSKKGIEMANSLHEEVRQILDSAVAEDGIPGIVAEVHDTGGTWFGTAGVADLATGQRRQPGEHLHIGSSGKAFTAATMLTLAAEGRLSLEDPVSTWLPGVVEAGGFGYDGDKITIRQLLNHTSGLFLTGLAPELQQSMVTDPARVWATSDLLKLAVSQPPAGAPGERFVYANGGYYLAGAIIERVTGNTYAAEVERTVIRPLGLTRTCVRPADATGYPQPHPTLYMAGALKDGVDPATLTAETWASMIDPDKPPIDVTTLNTSWGWAAGGVVSTTEDLSRFLRAIATGDLLPPAQHREMWTMVGGDDVVWLPHARYGLGVIEFDRAGMAGLTVRGVSGTLPGSFTLALTTDDGSRGVVIHTNIEPNAMDLPIKIIKAMYGVSLR